MTWLRITVAILGIVVGLITLMAFVRATPHWVTPRQIIVNDPYVVVDEVILNKIWRVTDARTGAVCYVGVEWGSCLQGPR